MGWKNWTALAIAFFLPAAYLVYVFVQPSAQTITREMVALHDCQKLAAVHKQVYFDVYYDDKDGSQAECKSVKIVTDANGTLANSYEPLFSRGIASRGTPLRPH